VTLAAVLWDMDGTIVDTEPYWMQATVDLVTSHGGRWTLADGLTLVGQELLTSARDILRRTGIALSPPQVVDALVTIVVARVREGAPWQPGARELLASLREHGVPLALVTMSYSLLAEAVVDQLPVGTFDSLVTGDRVSYGKPHPEPYLTAAAEVGADPRRCVAIEDSPTGLASAEAAGCRSLGVEKHVTIPPAPGRSRLPSLAGVSVADLARIAAGQSIDML